MEGHKNIELSGWMKEQLKMRFDSKDKMLPFNPDWPKAPSSKAG